MCSKFQKVKHFFKNIFQKIPKFYFSPEIRHFFIKHFLYYFIDLVPQPVRIGQNDSANYRFVQPNRHFKNKIPPKRAVFLEAIHKPKFYKWVIWIIIDFFACISQRFVFGFIKFCVCITDYWVAAVRGNIDTMFIL